MDTKEILIQYEAALLEMSEPLPGMYNSPDRSEERCRRMEALESAREKLAKAIDKK
jgi:hypothetical protein